MLNPVSVSVLLPEAYKRFSDPLALLVSLPTGSACHRKFWLTAVPVPLLKTDALKFNGWEFLPAVTVAVPVVGRVNAPRTVPAPLTSSVVAGLVVLIPILAVEPVPD
jgi:hypothetical protein